MTFVSYGSAMEYYHLIMASLYESRIKLENKNPSAVVVVAVDASTDGY